MRKTRRIIWPRSPPKRLAEMAEISDEIDDETDKLTTYKDYYQIQKYLQKIYQPNKSQRNRKER